MKRTMTFSRIATVLFTAFLLVIVAAELDAQTDTTKRKTPPPPAPQDETGVGESIRSLDMKSLEFSVPAARAAGGGFVGNAAPQFGKVSMSGYATTLGATVGGAQDIGYARQLIESGRVPRFLDFSPEGLYSEHDIPTPSSECDDKLCLSLGYGYAPTVDNQSNALFVHLGMNSNIRPEEFHRPSLQLALVIDRSGSMQGPSMESVKTALRALIERLTSEDEIALVEFNNNAKLLLAPTRVSDREAILAAIDALEAGGGTNIEAGLALGFEQVAGLPAGEGTSKRVMLFTDAMPNIGRTDSAGFRELTARYAGRGIGLTAFGVGVDFGQELIYHISQLRGGNFFFLESPEKIAKVFDTEFDYLVTPLVYDLNVTIETPKGLKLTAVYGLPTWKSGDRDAILSIPTVFLSSSRGAIILRYERDGDGPLALADGDLIATGAIRFTDTDGSHHAQQTELRSGAMLEPGTQFYTHDGMRMAVGLTNIFFGLRDACTLMSEGLKKDALNAIARARAAALLENLYLNDDGLMNEIKLLAKLAENIEKGEDVREPATDIDGMPRLHR